MLRVNTLRLAATLALLGCAVHHRAPGTRYDQNLITEDEIAASHSANAYDVIHKLRGNFLSNRGTLTFYGEASPMPTVYVDEQRYGDINTLVAISAEVIASIRLYRSWEATTRYGMNNMGGVIAITTRHGEGEDVALHDRP